MNTYGFQVLCSVLGEGKGKVIGKERKRKVRQDRMRVLRAGIKGQDGAGALAQRCTQGFSCRGSQQTNGHTKPER